MWYLLNSTGTPFFCYKSIRPATVLLLYALFIISGQRIYLKPNQELTFGRKKSDILLKDDESISRIHASIHLQPKKNSTGTSNTLYSIKDAAHLSLTVSVPRGVLLGMEKENLYLFCSPLSKAGKKNYLKYKFVYEIFLSNNFLPISASITSFSYQWAFEGRCHGH